MAHDASCAMPASSGSDSAKRVQRAWQNSPSACGGGGWAGAMAGWAAWRVGASVLCGARTCAKRRPSLERLALEGVWTSKHSEAEPPCRRHVDAMWRMSGGDSPAASSTSPGAASADAPAATAEGCVGEAPEGMGSARPLPFVEHGPLLPAPRSGDGPAEPVEPVLRRERSEALDDSRRESAGEPAVPA
jgi:hypothetical protein